MVINLMVPDEIAAVAKARGQRVEEYVQELLAQQLGAHLKNGSSPQTETEVRAWLSSMVQFSEKIPPLPEIISRDWIYQEHD
jgi:hypothetical protein